MEILSVRFCFLFLLTFALKAQIGIVTETPKRTTLVLGDFSHGNYQTNVINREIDDITTPTRQKQIIELVEKLKKFNPPRLCSRATSRTRESSGIL